MDQNDQTSSSSSLGLPAQDHSAWKEHSSQEVGFWRQWIRSGGMRWKEGFERKTNTQAPLAPLVANLLPKIALHQPGKVEILDIGSGPLSWVGTQHPGYDITLTAVDPLADEYNDELDKKGVTGGVRAIKGYFETAMSQLGANRFDVVWCANSLDHSLDPVIGLYNIINVCRAGGGVILMFHPDEAEQENYVGLHQWNLNVTGNRMRLSHKGRVFDLSALLHGQEDITVRTLGTQGKDKPRFVVSFRKVVDCNLSHALTAMDTTPRA